MRTGSTCSWCWSSCPDKGVWGRGVWRGPAVLWASLHPDLSTHTQALTPLYIYIYRERAQHSSAWFINSPLKHLLPEDRESRSQRDVLKRATVPLSEISRVAMEETLGKSSWITAAPADLSWRQRERDRDGEEWKNQHVHKHESESF